MTQLLPRLLLVLVVILTTSVTCLEASQYSQYMDERNKLVDFEDEIKDGSLIHFTPDEEKANDIFAAILQAEELQLSNNDPSAINFFNMPKGSILHAHQDSSATYGYLIQVASYLPNCYLYTANDQPTSGVYYGSFRFFSQQPSNPHWTLLATLRQQVSNVPEFDQQLLNNLTLVNEDFGDYISLWRKFDGVFGRISGLVTYTPVAIQYMQHLINESIADNVKHIELRKCFGSFYDLAGHTYNDTWFVENMIQLVESNRVSLSMPELNIKIIGCDGRHSNKSVVFEHMSYALELRNQFPQMFLGYDLVGPEDEGYPLLYFLDEFFELAEMSKSRKYPLEYYFHAGETLLYNNTNLYDAILLNSRRIGHGIQLSKHPLLVELVKEGNIGIEVCPISNQILEYVADFRAHPAFDLFNLGLPVTINPDDPAIFGYGGSSYDFYEVATSWGLDIGQLKQLAINSLNQSAYFDDNEKDIAFKAWVQDWNNFIQYVLTLTPPSSN
eukprot:gene5883-6805_t